MNVASSSTAQPSRQHDDAPRTERPDGVLAVLLLFLAAGLALNSVLGRMMSDVIDYSLSEGLRNQLIGLDAVSLVLVAPLCVLAALVSCVMVVNHDPHRSVGATALFLIAAAAFATFAGRVYRPLWSPKQVRRR